MGIPTLENLTPEIDSHVGHSGHQGVDKGLIKLFLALSPEDRLLSNDKTIQALTELKHAFNQKATRP